MFGYVAFYLRITMQDGAVAYTKYESDFTKDAITVLLDFLKQTTKEVYEKQGYQVALIETCTKEEFSASNGETMARGSWKDGDPEFTNLPEELTEKEKCLAIIKDKIRMMESFKPTGMVDAANIAGVLSLLDTIVKEVSNV
jgi:hypothetical protein